MKYVISVFSLLFVVSCVHQTPKTMSKANIDGKEVLATLLEANPDIKALADESVAYVIYPHVAKGAAGVGGAYGKGEVYEKRALVQTLVGYSELKQVDIGLELGGKTFGQVVFFKNADAFTRFKRGEIDLSGDISGVAIKKGKAVIAGHGKGFSVVIWDQKGLMGELSFGGQQLSYIPLK